MLKISTIQDNVRVFSESKRCKTQARFVSNVYLAARPMLFSVRCRTAVTTTIACGCRSWSARLEENDARPQVLEISRRTSARLEAKGLYLKQVRSVRTPAAEALRVCVSRQPVRACPHHAYVRTRGRRRRQQGRLQQQLQQQQQPHRCAFSPCGLLPARSRPSQSLLVSSSFPQELRHACSIGHEKRQSTTRHVPLRIPR